MTDRSPEALLLALRLFLHEVGVLGAPVALAEAAERVNARLRGHLARLIGRTGYTVLVARAVRDIVCVPKDQRGFVVQKFRWIVERTFAILGRYRRLAKDFEAIAQTGETFIYMAMAHLLVKRLAVSS